MIDAPPAEEGGDAREAPAARAPRIYVLTVSTTAVALETKQVALDCARLSMECTVRSGTSSMWSSASRYHLERSCEISFYGLISDRRVVEEVWPFLRDKYGLVCARLGSRADHSVCIK